MYIAVKFGYNQQKIFNTNCQVAPLVDAIHEGCYKDMQAALKKRAQFFEKEIQAQKNKEKLLLKRLEKLEPPAQASQITAHAEKDAKKKLGAKGLKNQAGGKAPAPAKKKTKEQLKKEEEERKRQEEEAERLRLEEEEKARIAEEERLKKEEEEKKAAKGKGKGGKKAEEEKKDEPVVETEEQKLERQKAEVNKELEELRKYTSQLQEKVKLIAQNTEIVNKEALVPKTLDLVDRADSTRKNLNGQGEAYGNEILGDRKIYTLVEIKKAVPEGGQQEEEIAKPIEIDGHCMRTPSEDLVWEEEQKELEAAAAKKAPKGGKKK